MERQHLSDSVAVISSGFQLPSVSFVQISSQCNSYNHHLASSDFHVNLQLSVLH